VPLNTSLHLLWKGSPPEKGRQGTYKKMLLFEGADTVIVIKPSTDELEFVVLVFAEN